MGETAKKTGLIGSIGSIGLIGYSDGSDSGLQVARPGFCGDLHFKKPINNQYLQQATCN
jgi:hypothetical protein